MKTFFFVRSERKVHNNAYGEALNRNVDCNAKVGGGWKNGTRLHDGQQFTRQMCCLCERLRTGYSGENGEEEISVRTRYENGLRLGIQSLELKRRRSVASGEREGRARDGETAESKNSSFTKACPPSLYMGVNCPL